MAHICQPTGTEPRSAVNPSDITQNFAAIRRKTLKNSGRICPNLDFPDYLKREFPAHNAKPYDPSRISIAQRKTYGEATLLNCFEGIVPKAGAQPGSGCGGWAATHASSIDTPRPGASGTER